MFGRSKWLDRVMKKRILVHTREGRSIEGVLMERVGDGLILRAAILKGEHGQADVSMAGEVFVPRDTVAFAQLDE